MFWSFHFNIYINVGVKKILCWECVLAHLRRRLKWAFLIKICPLSVDFIVVVVVVENCVGDSKRFKWRVTPFSRWDNSKIAIIRWRNLKKKSFQEPMVHFQRNWHKASLGEGDLSLFNWTKGIISKKRKYIILRIWKLFSRTTGPILTKLGTKNPLVKGIQDSIDKKHSIKKKVMMVFLLS